MASALDLNYANAKKLSEFDRVKLMLSPHTSSSLMTILEYFYYKRILGVLESDAAPNNVTIDVPCVFLNCEETENHVSVTEKVSEANFL